ncbi:MAG: glycoside hydrolase family 2 protein [Acidobacteria bacterium]|nr:MAG: glycoside hydrolase family 2 protein [Acidobacteriota bacterium]
MSSRGWSRRQLLKTSASAAGLALTPRFTGILGAAGNPADHSADFESSPPYGQSSAKAPRERLLADFGWKFSLGHANDAAKDFGFGRGGIFAKSGNLIGGGRNSVTSATFDDASWRSVDLPHDWAIDLPFVNDRSLDGHGYKPLGRTYPETSIGWYRRTFDIPATDAGRRISLTFDGVYRDAMVVLNNHYLGRNLSGYTPVRYDVTDFLNYGGRNVLVVRVDATENEGWFYEGAGIYRHVWVEKTAPLHVAHDGAFVTSDVHADGSATVKVQVEVVNEQDKAVTASVKAAISGSGPAQTLPLSLGPWETKTVTQRFTVAKPRLWSIDTPNLYTATVSIGDDSVDTTFGIRTIRFDADKGFFLNGQPVKVKGMCNHQDHAGVGAALPDALQDFRIRKLKEMGTNAYRSSHNPPTPELLDACDRLGMLVMDETRMMDSSEEGLLQLERLIRRDRNHPSVFMWSIGNEEPEQNTERGGRIGASMIRLVKRLDPTRPITEANNGATGWNRGVGVGPLLDVFGFNYTLGGTDSFHEKFPKQPTIGSEWASTVSTRGVYENDLTKGYVSAYDRNFPPWASTAETWWKHADERPWVAGGFVWTGFDYRGEPTPYQWPCINSHFGILDMCGFPKDLFYYYKAWWTNESVLHLFPHWNWAGKEGQPVEVWAFTNCDTVELFVNGVTAGWQKVEKNGHVAWNVRYQPGAIEVRGRHPNRAGTLVARRETTGVPAKLVLRTDRTALVANGEDTIVAFCEVQDSDGRIVPTAANEVQFSVGGPVRIIGVGNGDPSSHEPDRATKRSAFNGLCMCLVQSRGGNDVFTIEAQSPGLETTSVSLRASGHARPAL